MRQLRQPAQADTAKPAAVYLVHRTDRRRFKLGWALQPMLRAHKLPEFSRGELDLDASRAIWLPNRQRAEQVERSMHKTFAPYRATAGHHGDGHCEWFVGAMADQALRLLGQMPLDETSPRTARVVRISLPQPPADAVSIENRPQDVWWRIEDVLARLGMQLPVSVLWGHQITLIVHGFRAPDTPVPHDLRRAVLDVDTYQTWCDARPLSFVSLIAYDGADPVVEFKSLKAIERWDDGDGLVWQIKGFLARLQRTAPIRRTGMEIDLGRHAAKSAGSSAMALRASGSEGNSV